MIRVEAKDLIHSYEMACACVRHYYRPSEDESPEYDAAYVRWKEIYDKLIFALCGEIEED